MANITQAELDSLYNTFLGRDSGAAATGWLGMDYQQALAGISGSDEAQAYVPAEGAFDVRTSYANTQAELDAQRAAAPNITQDQLNTLYNTYFGRDPTAAADVWLGVTEAEALAGIKGSQEYANQGGQPANFNYSFEQTPEYADIIAAAANDPNGILIPDAFVDINQDNLTQTEINTIFQNDPYYTNILGDIDCTGDTDTGGTGGIYEPYNGELYRYHVGGGIYPDLQGIQGAYDDVLAPGGWRPGFNRTDGSGYQAEEFLPRYQQYLQTPTAGGAIDYGLSALPESQLLGYDTEDT